MDCFFINLDQAIDRRRTLESNLKCEAPHWQLHRVAALNPDQAAQMDLPYGVANAPAAHACYLSHVSALRQSLSFSGPAYILEDDSLLGRNTAPLLENILKQLDPGAWDILYTSATLMNVSHIVNAFFTSEKAMRDQLVILSDLQTTDFACATSYVVNSRSKEKILNLLEQQKSTMGYDICLRDLIRASQIKGFITLPFLTSVSEHSRKSQLNRNQEHDAWTDLVLNAIRKLLYVNSSLEEIKEDLAATGNYFRDERLQLLGQIYGMINHLRFTGK